MKTLNYILISATFVLSACASGQYTSSEDGIYFNPDKPYIPAPTPAMTKAKQLNEKTQTAVAARAASTASKKQIDTLYVTDENRTVDIDAEPDKTCLIMDESDSYARRLRMFDDDEEYVPPTVNINIDAGYGDPYSWYRPWWRYGSYYAPWYGRTSWAWYDYWDPWYYHYPGYYHSWYYGGYYGYHYPHYYSHHYPHHHNYYYHNNNVNYGRRLTGTGTVRRVSPDAGANTGSTGVSRRAASRTQPQIQQVGGTRQSSNSAVSSRRSVSTAGSTGTSVSTQQSTGTSRRTAVTSRSTGSSAQSANYTRSNSNTSRGTSTSTYNNSTTTNSRRSNTSYSNSNSNSSSRSSQSPSYNSSSRSSSSSSQVRSSSNSSSSSNRSTGSSSGGSSRRR
ncbi:MAG: hypothetical protein LBT49_04600 [Prevotellaceae bacterium]|nr:hypothetical protein [Prevotellaceae bacterium]